MNTNQIVENKEDTPERLAYMAGKPSKNFMTAPNINAIVSCLRILWSLANFDGALLVPSVKKELGTITGSFVDFINSHAASVYPSPAFVIYTISGIEYVQAFVGPTGTYGTGQLQVNAEHFILVHQSDQDQPTLPSRRIFFGEITGTNFIPGKNTLGYTVTAVQVGEYLKTNIPFSQRLYVNIIDKYLFGGEGGGYTQSEYYDIGGFLAFKNIHFDGAGDVTDGGEFTHCRISIEQL